MAINPSTQYPAPATSAPGTDYPYGGANNESVAGALDGFPFEKAGINDLLGFFQSTFRAIGTAPNSSAETAPISQVLRNLQTLASSGSLFNDSGVADAYALDARTNQQAPEAYVEGMIVRCEIGNTSTGASTINVNALGVKTIEDVGAGTLIAGQVYSFRYDGTNFVVLPEFRDVITGNATVPAGILAGTTSGKFVKNDGVSYGAADSTSSRDHVKYYNSNGELLKVKTSGTTSTISNEHATGSLALNAGAGGLAIQLNPGGDANFSVVSGIDNTVKLGGASSRWEEVFAGNGTINTSDETEKTEFSNLTDEVLDVLETFDAPETYKMISAVDKKGDEARIHVGYVVQKIWRAFESAGLDPSRFSFICYDKWEDKYEDNVLEVEYNLGGKRKKQAVLENSYRLPSGATILSEKIGSVKVQSAGDRYGFRYNELLCAFRAVDQRKMSRLENRVKALESA